MSRFVPPRLPGGRTSKPHLVLPFPAAPLASQWRRRRPGAHDWTSIPWIIPQYNVQFPWSLPIPMYGTKIYIWMIFLAKCMSTIHGCHVLRDLRAKPTTSNKYTALSQASEEVCTIYFNQVLERQSQSLDLHQFKWTQKPKLSESKCLETSTQSCFHMMIF